MAVVCAAMQLEEWPDFVLQQKMVSSCLKLSIANSIGEQLTAVTAVIEEYFCLF